MQDAETRCYHSSLSHVGIWHAVCIYESVMHDVINDDDDDHDDALLWG